MAAEENEKVRFAGEWANEKTLFVLRAHGFTNISWVLPNVILLMLPLVVWSFWLLNLSVKVPLSFLTGAMATLVWVLVVLGVAFQQFLHWYFNLYILTDKRLVDVDFI